MRRILVLLVAVAGVLLLGWVVLGHHHSPEQGDDQPPAVSSTLLALPTATSTAVSSATSTGGAGGGGSGWSPRYTPTTISDTTWQSAAAQFTRVFADPVPASGVGSSGVGSATPGVSDGVAAAWWGRVKPWLTPAAQQAFAGTDPRQVPFTRVTGAAVLLDSGYPPSVLAMARVPTDHGDWYVAMVRYTGSIHVSWCGTDVSEMPR